MTDIPKLEYAYTTKVDWEGTLARLEVNEKRLCELNESQYALFRIASRKLRQADGRQFHFRKIIGTAYTIERTR